jgi:ferritin-like metal-binding protein YciE
MEEYEKGPVLDLAIVASFQRVEHYEIAAYGTMVELANATQQIEVAELLSQTLAEEKAQDERLTEVTRATILPQALEQESGSSGDVEGGKSAERKAKASSKLAG